MIERTREMTASEWLRAYTVRSRSGYVTKPLGDCKMAWESEFLGNPGAAEREFATRPAIERMCKLSGGSMTFPLTVYRIMNVATDARWKAGLDVGPMAVTASLEIAQAFGPTRTP